MAITRDWIRDLAKITASVGRAFKTEAGMALWLKSTYGMIIGPPNADLDPNPEGPRAIMLAVAIDASRGLRIPPWGDLETTDAEHGRRPYREADGRAISGHVVWRRDPGDFWLTLY